MKILVTGAAGFIGSHYVRTMLAGGYAGYEDASVTVLDKLTYAGNLANLEPVAGKFTFVRGDICDAALLAASVPRVVHVSTDEVYGSIPEGAWTEASPLDPNSPYSAAKAGVDLIALAYARTHGVNVSITRCCNNYGPYQYPEKVIPLFATNLLDGKPVPLYGDGLNVRGWIHVDDHCHGIQLVLERGATGHVYNINGNAELPNRELTEAILQTCGASWEMVIPVSDRKGHDRRYSLDDSLLRSMGYAPQVPFGDGLKATIEWYTGNRDWWEPLHRPAPPERPQAAG